MLFSIELSFYTERIRQRFNLKHQNAQTTNNKCNRQDVLKGYICMVPFKKMFTTLSFKMVLFEIVILFMLKF